MTATARESILNKIRAAGNASAHREEDYAVLPRPYIRHGALDRAACIALLVERLEEYGAEVEQISEAELPAAITGAIDASGKRRLVAPMALPSAWRTAQIEWKLDGNLPAAEIETTDGVVTAATCAVADSGTIVLHHGPLEGRRILTLLPDWHLCILRASHVVETLPEYFATVTEPPELATYISGPSATADIEMTRIKGVHGPRFLHVLLVRDDG